MYVRPSLRNINSILNFSQKALAFHHTFFKKRQINVELTAGGGGNKSESRKEKLKVKNERLTEERVSCMILFCRRIY